MERIILRQAPISQLFPVLNHQNLQNAVGQIPLFLKKQGKFDEEAIAEVEDAFGADEGGQTTLSQYALTAPVVCRLDEL